MSNATRTSIVERMAAGVVRAPSGCLEWSGSPDRYGYGRARVNGKTVGTHRIAWELANGPIPDGLHVLHHCDNPPCCETEPTEGYPDGHLFLGTNLDNIADMLAKGRHHNQLVTHCPQGHAYDETNTYLRPATGDRVCRECTPMHVLRRKERRQERARARSALVA